MLLLECVSCSSVQTFLPVVEGWLNWTHQRFPLNVNRRNISGHLFLVDLNCLFVPVQWNLVVPKEKAFPAA